MSCNVLGEHTVDPAAERGAVYARERRAGEPALRENRRDAIALLQRRHAWTALDHIPGTNLYPAASQAHRGVRMRFNPWRAHVRRLAIRPHWSERRTFHLNFDVHLWALIMSGIAVTPAAFGFLVAYVR
jgi:hypothetical protein